MVRGLEHLDGLWVYDVLGECTFYFWWRRYCILGNLDNKNHKQKKLTNPSFPTGGQVLSCWHISFPSLCSFKIDTWYMFCVQMCVLFFLNITSETFSYGMKRFNKNLFNSCVIFHCLSGLHISILLLYVFIFVYGFFNDLRVNTCTRQNIFLAKTLWTGITESEAECSTQCCGRHGWRCAWLVRFFLLGTEIAGISQPPLQPSVHLRRAPFQGSAGRGGECWVPTHLPPSQPLSCLRAGCWRRGAGAGFVGATGHLPGCFWRRLEKEPLISMT